MYRPQEKGGLAPALRWAALVAVSSGIPDGRMPTHLDLKAVLESFEGYTVTFRGSEEHPQTQIDSIEMVDWY